MQPAQSQFCVVEINPSAKYEWDRCSVRNPLSMESVDFKQLVVDAFGGTSGRYLVEVRLEVKPLTSYIPESMTLDAVSVEADNAIAA